MRENFFRISGIFILFCFFISQNSEYTTGLASFQYQNDAMQISKANKVDFREPSLKNSSLEKSFVEDEIILKFKRTDLSKPEILKSDPFENYLDSQKEHFSNIYVYKLKKGIRVETAVLELQKDSRIEFAQPNYIYHTNALTDDPYSVEQWGLENIRQFAGGERGVAGIDIGIKEAWKTTYGKKDVIVAVVDTGCDVDHPDLKDNIWVNTGEIAGNGKDDDRNGYVDDVNGWDFFNNDNTLSYDGQGQSGFHGMHVAGIIAASKNNIGVVGVAPGVSIMPVKCGNRNELSGTSIYHGIIYAKSKGAKIINCSWSVVEDDLALISLMKESGLLFVLAAGNEGLNINCKDVYHKLNKINNVIVVAAINNRGQLADFSNYSEDLVDVAAPGEGIFSTYTTSKIQPSYFNAYKYQSGTSMAAPFVSGIAALMMSNGIEDPAYIKAKIISSCTPLTGLKGTVVSGGMVNAGAALRNSNDDLPGLKLQAVNTGNLNSENIDNVYYVDLEAGESVEFDLAKDTDADTSLRVLGIEAISKNKPKGLVTSSSNTENKSQILKATAVEPGRYYIIVHLNKGTCNYTLKAARYPVMQVITLSEDNYSIIYSGKWGQVVSKESEGGVYKTLNSPGSAKICFKGTEIKWIGHYDASQGKALIRIDNKNDCEVDLFSKTTGFKQVIYQKQLPYGDHVVEVVWTGKTESVKKTGAAINIDCFLVKTQ